MAVLNEPAIGIIGGSGFYNLPGLTDVRRVEIDTPFGCPSDGFREGRLSGRRVVFLARHGEHHTLLPGEINARANLYGFKQLGVTKLISMSAVGSLREEIAPGHIVIPRQYIDRTVARPSTFFGEGIVAHVSLADPVCASLSDTLVESARSAGTVVHPNGVYLGIEGPQFSTRAESLLWRTWGADVIGMTNFPEVRLAREAEMCYGSLALSTDYDCWRAPDEQVLVTDVLSVLRENAERARRTVEIALTVLDPAAPCACHRVLDTAILTPLEHIPASTRQRLHALLERRLRQERVPIEEPVPAEEPA